MQYDYDLLVIGGGSGGLAASKEAAALGAKVAVCDYVTPSPKGTTWGLGGTCVNVGCIPKKLMHQACLLGLAVEDAKSFGWKLPDEKTHDWETMVNNVQDYISGLNFRYRTELRTKKVDYLNALAVFVDEHTVELTDRKGNVSRKTAENFIVATGGRPKYLGIPNEMELCITSDDLFSLSSPPGKTLVVGASYVALECAGFLRGLNYDTTVMMRSIPLRGFDQQCAEMICSYMEEEGTKFIRGCIPAKIEKAESGKIKVFWKPTNGGDTMESDEYDTVMLAIGRYALTEQCGVQNAGIKTDPSSKKIIGTGTGVGLTEQSNVDHIYAIGDVLHGYPELTPVAIQAGILLARRIFGASSKAMDYEKVPTAVFTPVEYGCVGLSEEDAIARHGEENIEVYHQSFKPLELTVPGRGDNAGYLKVIVDKKDNERVLGMHYLGWGAGEIMQGFAIALKLRATKEDLDELVGIHPTSAELFTTLKVTKSSGLDFRQAGC
ncbi:hypothetical protein GUITHDRAFT_90077 [Guillardia theta CCMP2712]|uniref:thioredoxin-disulfide reductase (NADPH) n=2 Tax=Guillardia theta TaxID=55529 RepID=L1IIL0_GUITC|nr:hypothetical protein GUITHDRAFT_90077 [Guillardia theta CCMP2712]EKX36093.1 hypothetical protein GUITHDRAFT_90077 [Guillardia theta CCMP2712]|mmetsp:Transcript_48839/g.153378  ORF Transcript_48839/g.153378 Transcript_48839/m.153378 type:complete len:493 (+) Transcript_48839:138-1616(+)|eukprot:XP_005823073.1 hypothetical protein GUITHDRAFT_90077 [Guillardia theta CCMP2712]